MSEAHTSSNEMSGDGIEVSPPGGNGAPPTPDWQQFLIGIEKLNENLGTKLDGVRSTVLDVTRPPPAAPPEAPDYNSMSQAELAAHMHGSLTVAMQEAIKAALAPVTETLSKLGTDVTTTKGSLELRDVQSKYKDFRDWKDQMIELVKVHPTLTFDDVYKLARANDPKRAAELDNKYNPPPPKPRPFGFSALTPSGNGKSSAPILSGEEATKAAYNEVMARHPGILPALQEL